MTSGGGEVKVKVKAEVVVEHLGEMVRLVLSTMGASAEYDAPIGKCVPAAHFTNLNSRHHPSLAPPTLRKQSGSLASLPPPRSIKCTPKPRLT